MNRSLELSAADRRTHSKIASLPRALGVLIVAALWTGFPALAAEPSEGKSARVSDSLLDLGLKVVPDVDQGDEIAALPAPPPNPKPASDRPQSTKKAPPTNVPSPGVAGDYNEGSDAVHIDAQGIITADRLVQLDLQGTEGEHFIVEGELYPAKEPTQYNNGQVYFYLRQLGGMNRIELSINHMRGKRILLGGEMIQKYAFPMKFREMKREAWHPFKIEVAPDGIVVQFDRQKDTVKGKTETAGSNRIVLGPGAKLRNVKVTILKNRNPNSTRPVQP